MKHVTNYSSFNERSNSSEDILIPSIIKNLSRLQAVIREMKGLYIPFSFKDKTIHYEVDRVFMEIFDYKTIDVLKMFLSRKLKQVRDNNFDDFVNGRLSFNLIQNCNFLLKELNEKNLVFSTLDVVKTDQLEVYNALIGIVNNMSDFIDNISKTIIDDSVLSKIEKMLKMLTILLKRDNTPTNETYIYENNEFVDSIDIVEYVNDKYSNEELISMLNKEKAEWVDDIDDYDESLESAAEEIILNKLINEYVEEFSIELTDDMFNKLVDQLIENFDFLS